MYSECNEFGYTGYVCFKKNKSFFSVRSRAEVSGGGSRWVKKDNAIYSVSFDVIRVDMVVMEEDIRIIFIKFKELEVLVGKYSKFNQSDEEERLRGKEVKGEFGSKVRKLFSEIFMLEVSENVRFKGEGAEKKNEKGRFSRRK